MSTRPYSLAKPLVRNPHPIGPSVRIGHVHLKVADLDRALDFYSGVLGFELMQRFGNQAAFISAGGYLPRDRFTKTVTEFAVSKQKRLGAEKTEVVHYRITGTSSAPRHSRRRVTCFVNGRSAADALNNCRIQRNAVRLRIVRRVGGYPSHLSIRCAGSIASAGARVLLV